MCRGGVCSGGEVGTPRDQTFALRGDSDSQAAGVLFEGGLASRHFARVSNIWDWKARRLLEWHREKAGRIEAVHDVVKNELAGGVLPSKYFGANAAWLRLVVIVSCAEDGVALGDEAGAAGGMAGSLEAASLADIRRVLSADKQATFREPRGRVRARCSLRTASGR